MRWTVHKHWFLAISWAMPGSSLWARWIYMVYLWLYDGDNYWMISKRSSIVHCRSVPTSLDVFEFLESDIHWSDCKCCIFFEFHEMDVSEYSPGVSEKNIHLQRLQSMGTRAIYFSSISCFVDSGSVSTQWLPVAHHNPETGGFFYLQIQTIWDLTSGEYCQQLRILTSNFSVQSMALNVSDSNWLSSISKLVEYVGLLDLEP